MKQIGDYEVYKAGNVLGFQAYKFGDDYALLSESKELLVGDNARGGTKGNVLIFPEFNLYTPGPPYPAPEDIPRKFRDSLRNQFKDISQNHWGHFSLGVPRLRHNRKPASAI